jgi:5'-nucleotidase
MEGYLFGIRALAFSQTEKGWAHLQDAAQVAKDLVMRFAHQGLDLPGSSSTSGAWLLNVNIPNLPRELIKSPQVCRLGRRHAAEPVEIQQSPRGETLYWIGAAGPVADSGPGTDFAAAAEGHVTITPLQVDLTDHERLGAWRSRVD